ncbi:MAG: MEKHLA domain-containing protein [Cellvibrionales bacterium]|nr:MEKHLA domain-containing protein [Cellvibrionales bacterium]
MAVPDYLMSSDVETHLSTVVESYQRCYSEPMFADTYQGSELVEKVWQAAFALVSHGTEDDPIFNFANQTALDLFEMDFETFTSLPSKQSAENEKLTQTERDALLKEVTNSGCIDNYSGVRISAKGRRFFVENARVWNLTDTAGKHVGQAALLRQWKFID